MSTTEFKKGKIADGYHNAGREFQILGFSVNVNDRLWVPVLFDDEQEPDWLKSSAVVEIPVKNSASWMSILYPNGEYKIIDPDGWDRGNFDYSYNQELVSEKEFHNRLANSTVQRTTIIKPNGK